VGIGNPLEASFTLKGPVRAGTWHLVGDGIVFQSVDVQYDVLWRPSGGAPDTVLATWQMHFDPPTGAGQFDAVPFEGDASAPVANAAPGDQLVLRFTASNSPAGPAFIPNGDGAQAMGRIPSLSLPF
jgi:hypothetical protein